MKIAVISCLHGNEKYGLEVINKLPSHISSFIGNKKAVKENKRFIDVDLNRCFPGKDNGNNEEKIANELLKKLRDFDYVIDLHSTSNNCPLFGIITKPNKPKIEFAEKLGLKKLVIMSPRYASGKSLIDHVKCGISLEIGPHEQKENVNDTYNILKNLIYQRKTHTKLEIFEVFSVIKKNKQDILINNFENIRKGQIIAKDNLGNQKADFNFTAILVGEKSYSDVLCLACRKISSIQTLLS